jgi:hypothetical protein
MENDAVIGVAHDELAGTPGSAAKGHSALSGMPHELRDSASVCHHHAYADDLDDLYA